MIAVETYTTDEYRKRLYVEYAEEIHRLLYAEEKAELLKQKTLFAADLQKNLMNIVEKGWW